jgi:thioredoxin reductase (NADPH)
MSSKIFDTVIVGAGVSGLSCAIELKIENIENILLIEKSDNFFNTIGYLGTFGKNATKKFKDSLSFISQVPF